MSALKTHCLVLLTIFLATAASPALSEVHRETREHRFPAAEVNELAILNLAGAVEIKGAPGNELVVRAVFNGEGRNVDEAKRNANLLDLDIQRSGKRVEIVTEYPVDEHDEFVYLRSSETSGGVLSNLFGGSSRTTTTYQGRRVSVYNGGGGLAVHADYEVLVPAGMTVTMNNKVGAIRARDVNGMLRLDGSSGQIAVSGGEGEVRADTGSGRIEIHNRTGDVFAETGSGGVQLRDIRGNIDADTGSGGVTVENAVGNVRADTGSGGVTLDNVTGSIWVDTGSGGTKGRNLQKVGELEIDTGSGSVQLEGDFSALQRMRIDTGSGGVRMKTSGTLNMRLSVSTGSGGVRVDLPEMKNVRSGHGEFEAEIGNGAGRGVIDTGSGGVRISSL